MCCQFPDRTLLLCSFTSSLLGQPTASRPFPASRLIPCLPGLLQLQLPSSPPISLAGLVTRVPLVSPPYRYPSLSQIPHRSLCRALSYSAPCIFPFPALRPLPFHRFFCPACYFSQFPHLVRRLLLWYGFACPTFCVKNYPCPIVRPLSRYDFLCPTPSFGILCSLLRRYSLDRFGHPCYCSSQPCASLLLLPSCSL